LPVKGTSATGARLASFLKMIEHSAKIMAEIKTYDQRTYELTVDGKSIKLK